MSLPRESGRVETDRIVWQEWICESEVNGSLRGRDFSSGCRVLTLQG